MAFYQTLTTFQSQNTKQWFSFQVSRGVLVVSNPIFLFKEWPSESFSPELFERFGRKMFCETNFFKKD